MCCACTVGLHAYIHVCVVCAACLLYTLIHSNHLTSSYPFLQLLEVLLSPSSISIGVLLCGLYLQVCRG